MSNERRNTIEKIKLARLLNRRNLRTTSGAPSQGGVGGLLPTHPHTGTGTGGSTLQPALLKLKAATTLTIATGVITATQTHHTIDTEAAAASDDLATINGLAANTLYLFRPANGARTVVVKHGTGNILCVGNADFTLDDVHDFFWAFSPDGTTVYALFDLNTGGIPTQIQDADGDTGWRAETNPDEDILRARTLGVERMFINEEGHVIIGDDPLVDEITVSGAAAAAAFTVNTTGTSTPRGLLFSTHTIVGSIGSFITIARSKGSHAAPTIVANNDNIATFDFLGYDGIDYERVAQMAAEVDGTPGSGDMPGRLVFKTTPDGASTVAERFRLNNAGVWVATTGRERWPLTGKTIASGQIAIASGDTGNWSLAGEGGVADDLIGITGGAEGDILVISPVSGSIDITVKHGNAGASAGAKIFLSSGAD